MIIYGLFTLGIVYVESIFCALYVRVAYTFTTINHNFFFLFLHRLLRLAFGGYFLYYI